MNVRPEGEAQDRASRLLACRGVDDRRPRRALAKAAWSARRLEAALRDGGGELPLGGLPPAGGLEDANFAPLALPRRRKDI